MRRALLPVLFWTLACSGLIPEPSDAPIAPQPDAAEGEVDDDDHGEPPDPGDTEHPAPLLTSWVAKGNTCRWVLYDLANNGAEVKTLAQLPIACGHYWTLSAGPDGRYAVQMERQAFAIDSNTAETTPLPTPPDMVLDGVGFDEAGQLAAWTQGGTYKEPAAEGEAGWFEWDGRRFDIPDFDADGMGYELCVAWSWEGGAWKELSTAIYDVHEGVSAPFCPGLDGDPIATEIARPSEAGGHGAFGSEPLDEDDLTDVLRAAGELNKLATDDVTFALKVEWLEGENYAQPVFLRTVDDDATTWVPLEGLQAGGRFDFDFQGEHFIGCGNAGSGVYEAATGKRIWQSDQALCPGWWAHLQAD